MRPLLALAIGALLIACSSDPWQPPERTWSPPWMAPVADPAPWRAIVVSGSGAPTGNLASLPPDRAAHFVIGGGIGSGEGQIEIGEAWTAQSGEPTIRIVLIADLATAGPSDRQTTELFRLLVHLTATYRIEDAAVSLADDVAAIDRQEFAALLAGWRD